MLNSMCQVFVIPLGGTGTPCGAGGADTADTWASVVHISNTYELHVVLHTVVFGRCKYSTNMNAIT